MSAPDDATIDVAAELEKLRAAVRKHRDQKGDDRCWLDDRELYKALPEGYDALGPQLDAPEVMLANCHRYIASRHDPSLAYLSPQREVERLTEHLELVIAERDQARAERGLAVAPATDVWFWQDEGNHPEDLVCPVVMSADTLRGLLKQAADARVAEGEAVLVLESTETRLGLAAVRAAHAEEAQRRWERHANELEAKVEMLRDQLRTAQQALHDVVRQRDNR